MTTFDGWTILSSHDVDQQTDALIGPLTRDIYALETSRNELNAPRPVISALNLARAVMGQRMVKRQPREKSFVKALVKPEIRDNALFLVDTIHSPLFERALTIIACIHVEVDTPAELSLPIQSMLIKKGLRDFDSRFSKNPDAPTTLIFTYPGGVGMSILLPLKSGPLCYLFHATRDGKCTCAISNNPRAQSVWFEQFHSRPRRDAGHGTPFLAYILQHRECSREDFRTKDADAETQRLLDISLNILDSERELEKWRPAHEEYCRLDQLECQQCRRIFLRLPGPLLESRNRPLPEVPSSAGSSGTGETCVRTPVPKRENSGSGGRVSREKMMRVKLWRKKTFQVSESAGEEGGYWHELDPGRPGRDNGVQCIVSRWLNNVGPSPLMTLVPTGKGFEMQL
ncbi:uncharacterized protein EV420DRAFT_1474545 [Desarmillaria tabescens]|uniref:Uncharacterized protein n=1 Tax=Armillaria tabescens TaxID=1929756 RepID=A0AA39TQP6_ARMTA|nr:uncharacterized protein EV420DRAFT_1474545 [Desarmillaria tabescens]KAK0467172.1 hypothetical protein EV420DRAFT_1474545 [Desarmillaria tabescens]